MKSIRTYFFTLKLRIIFSFLKDEEKKYLDTPDLKLMRKKKMCGRGKNSEDGTVTVSHTLFFCDDALLPTLSENKPQPLYSFTNINSFYLGQGL